MFEGRSPSGGLNKRPLRGSLWFRRQETFAVCHVQLSLPHFFLSLIHIDQELATQAQAAGCRW
jgi:hypothetical protein